MVVVGATVVTGGGVVVGATVVTGGAVVVGATVVARCAVVVGATVVTGGGAVVRATVVTGAALDDGALVVVGATVVVGGAVVVGALVATGVDVDDAIVVATDAAVVGGAAVVVGADDNGAKSPLASGLLDGPQATGNTVSAPAIIPSLHAEDLPLRSFPVSSVPVFSPRFGGPSHRISFISARYSVTKLGRTMHYCRGAGTDLANLSANRVSCGASHRRRGMLRVGLSPTHSGCQKVSLGRRRWSCA